MNPGKSTSSNMLNGSQWGITRLRCQRNWRNCWCVVSFYAARNFHLSSLISDQSGSIFHRGETGMVWFDHSTSHPEPYQLIQKGSWPVLQDSESKCYHHLQPAGVTTLGPPWDPLRISQTSWRSPSRAPRHFGETPEEVIPTCGRGKVEVWWLYYIMFIQKKCGKL